MPIRQYYTGKELAKLLHVSEQRIAHWRQKGIRKSVRAGKGFLYREDWIDDMMDSMVGYDISSDEDVEISLNLKKAEEKSAPIQQDRARRRPS